jgi:hypothetical protein
LEGSFRYLLVVGRAQEETNQATSAKGVREKKEGNTRSKCARPTGAVGLAWVPFLWKKVRASLEGSFRYLLVVGRAQEETNQVTSAKGVGEKKEGNTRSGCAR